MKVNAVILDYYKQPYYGATVELDKPFEFDGDFNEIICQAVAVAGFKKIPINFITYEEMFEDYEELKEEGEEFDDFVEASGYMYLDISEYVHPYAFETGFITLNTFKMFDALEYIPYEIIRIEYNTKQGFTRLLVDINHDYLNTWDVDKVNKLIIDDEIEWIEYDYLTSFKDVQRYRLDFRNKTIKKKARYRI